MPMLRALKGKLDAFEYQYKTEIANLNAQVLMQGEEIKRLNSSLSDAHKNNRARKMTENSHAVEMRKLSDELSTLRHEAVGYQNVGEINARGLSGTLIIPEMRF